jgi:hypothetical protein
VRTGYLTVLFFLALVVSLLARAPATLLAPVLDDRSAHRLRLVDGKGSIWSGTAGLSCVLPEGTSINCGRWGWKLVPENLLQGRFSLLIRRDGLDQSMLVSWAAGGLELERVAISLPAALVGSLDPKIAALRLDGSLFISSAHHSSKGGQIKIFWQKMESSLLLDQPLGDHTIDVTTNEAGSSFVISSAPGPVVLSGGGTLSGTGKTSLELTATVNSKNAALPSLLSLLGREVTPGQFSLKLP